MIQDANLSLIQLPLGPMANFVYILADTESKACAIVDPGWDASAILTAIKEHSWTLTSIFLTHGHFDHVNALDNVLSEASVPIYLSQSETVYTVPDAYQVIPIADNDTITLGALQFNCIHTPGHTPGGMCFLYNKTLLTGDTLFVDGCGRCDLPGSDPEQMHASLQKLKTLSDDIVIYPGHHYGNTPSDSLGEQKKSNPYLSDASKNYFLKQRMG